MPTDDQTIDTPVVDGAPDQGGQNTGSALWVAVGVAFVAIVGLVAVVSGAGTSESAGNASSSDLFQFEFATAEGGTTTLAAYEGEPLVVNYFAAWCPPCRAELPDFEAVSVERAADVTFIGISKDNTTDAWVGLIDTTGVTFETIYEGNSAGSYEVVGGLAMPTTAFITADGEIAHVHSGVLDDVVLNQLIDEHLT